MIGIVRAVVPLAEASGGVAGLMENFSKRHFFAAHGLAAAGDAVDLGAQVVPARQQTGARRGADRTERVSPAASFLTYNLKSREKRLTPLKTSRSE